MALSAAALVPLTPLFWPLVWNDFRELQLAGPFVLWAVQGVRSRSAGWAALGIGGMLACRQEYAVMVATFAFLPPREPETLSSSLRWRRTVFLIGLVWLMAGFFGYLKSCCRYRMLPTHFHYQFMGTEPRISAQTLATSLETLLLGMGAWAVLACLAPRVAILALPWIWGSCSERWAMRLLSTSEWHNVRYVMPMAAITLAAGSNRLRATGKLVTSTARGQGMMVAAWLGSALFCGVGL